MTEKRNASKFIREQLEGNPNIKLSEINDAWKATGEESEISSSLFYQQRNKLGIGRRRKAVAKVKQKKRVGRPRKDAAAAPAEEAAAPAPTRGPGRPKGKATKGAKRGRRPKAELSGSYLAIEAGLDSLIHSATELGHSDLANELVVARRYASAKVVD